MSSSIVECINCEKGFDVADYPQGLAHPVVRELPWRCPHCNVLIDFVNRDKRWEGKVIVNE